MGTQADMEVAVSKTDDPPQVDLTGRSQMASNVLASWGGQLLLIAAGFIMPRLIDEQLGQEALGIWDFGWSLVGYFSLVQGGIASSINRYVAKFRAAGDHEGMNRAVSSVACVLLCMGGGVAILAVGVAVGLPYVFAERLGSHIEDGRWIVLLLGLSLAVQIEFSHYAGVITGCHRWGLHNALLAGTHAVKVLAMVVALFTGTGLVGLAIGNVCGEFVGRMASRHAAYRVCSQLRIRLSLARWATARRMLGFGGKAFIPQIAELLVNQTTAVLVVATLGPGALAVFARPRSVVYHLRTLVTRFAYVLTPTASSLQAMDQEAQLRDLLLTATRYGAYLVLPMVLVLAILGGPILRLWMGPDYENGWLLAILAVGNSASLVQLPVISILSGMNAHGRPGLANLVAGAGAVSLAFLALVVLRWGIVGAAVGVTLPPTIASVLYVPVYACHMLHVPVRRYVVNALLGPALCSIPFAVCLAISRLAFLHHPLASVMTGLGAGGLVLTALYWRFAFSVTLKRRLAKYAGIRMPAEDGTSL